VSGSNGDPSFASPRPGDLRRSVLDPELAARELGWRAETSLADGLRATWASIQ
jgi:UDP-glucose 4-epimerase